MDQPRDDLGRLMGLDADQLDQFFELVKEGHRPWTVAKFFGVTPQAFYNRMRRDLAFKVRYGKAEATAEIGALRKLLAFSEPAGVDASGPKDAKAARGEFVPVAWFLERRFGWGKIHEVEKAKALRREGKGDAASDRAQKLLATVAEMRRAAAGSPDATPNVPDHGGEDIDDGGEATT